jgi:hypothetical protein
MSTNNGRFTVDLDALEREGAPEPFTAQLGGEEFTFNDAQDVDWQELMDALGGDLKNFFRLTLGQDKGEEFLAKKLPTWKMRKLMELYVDHHGLGDQGNANGSSTR